jgi:hypothetical protein
MFTDIRLKLRQMLETEASRLSDAEFRAARTHIEQAFTASRSHLPAQFSAANEAAFTRAGPR